MKTFRQYLSIFTLLSVYMLTLSVCAGPAKRLEPPRIKLANIRVKELKAFEAAFLIELRVFNTNDVPVEITGVDCELELNGRHFASGISNEKTKIPSYGTGTLPVVVYSSVLDIVKSVLGLQNQEKLKYKITGRIRLKGGVLVPSVIPFTSDGELSMEGITDLK